MRVRCATGRFRLSTACTHTRVLLLAATGTVWEPLRGRTLDFTVAEVDFCHLTTTRWAGVDAVQRTRTGPVTVPELGVTCKVAANIGSPALGMADAEPGDLSETPRRLLAVTTTE